MRQSRWRPLPYVILGLLVAMATQPLVFPIVGLQASLAQNLKLALVFTGVSIARSYAMRRQSRRCGSCF